MITLKYMLYKSDQNKRFEQQRASGFTIVELLIVIVVIGILAAIVIVAYNGVRDRASTETYKSDAKNILKKAEAYAALNGGYPSEAAGSHSLFTVGSSDTAATTLNPLRVVFVTDLATTSYSYADLVKPAADGTYPGVPYKIYVGGNCGTTGFKIMYPDAVTKTVVSMTTGSSC